MAHVSGEAGCIAQPFQCLHCKRTYSGEISWKRHQQRCLRRTVLFSKQKACHACIAAKTRCDMGRPYCSRCLNKVIDCEYAVTLKTSEQRKSQSTGVPLSPIPSNSGNSPESGNTLHENNTLVEPGSRIQFQDFGIESQYHQIINSTYHTPPEARSDSGSAESIDGAQKLTRVRDRWICSFLPYAIGDCRMPPSVAEHMLQVFQTYPRMLARKRLPPIFHPTQISAGTILPPLANCLSITQLWAMQATQNWKFVEDTIAAEIRRLSICTENHAPVEEQLLPSLQALLMYAFILLMPPKAGNQTVFVDDVMIMNIHQVAYKVVTTGPPILQKNWDDKLSWQEWIDIEVRRRTLFTVYIVEYAVSTLRDLPSFGSEELNQMPAPAPKALWNATSEDEWRVECKAHIERWSEGPYLVGELISVWPELGLPDRSLKWLEDIDEFGMMIWTLALAYSRGRRGPS